MQSDPKISTRVASQPLGEQGDLPHPATGLFVECAACRAQPGSPILCSSCRHNRDFIAQLEQRVIALTPSPALLKQLGEQIQDLRRMRFFGCTVNGCKTDAPTCERCLFLSGLTNTLEQFAALDATKTP
jgi:hypothetical protein